MNSLNNSSVDLGARTAMDRVKRKREVGTGAFAVSRVNADTLGASIALELIDERVVVFSSDKLELLEREDLLEPLADFIRPVATSFLVML